MQEEIVDTRIYMALIYNVLIRFASCIHVRYVQMKMFTINKMLYRRPFIWLRCRKMFVIQNYRQTYYLKREQMWLLP